jgi:hypothetical protein
MCSHEPAAGLCRRKNEPRLRVQRASRGVNDPTFARARSPNARPEGRSRHVLRVAVAVRGESGTRHQNAVTDDDHV